MTEPETVPPTGPRTRFRRALPRWLSTRVVLAVAIALYFAVSLALSELRALQLSPQAYDLGIYQQSLWSTLHGRVLYEAGDYETAGYASLLIVHTGFVLFAVVPLYGLYPAPLTLFVVQSAAVALAAWPLYGLARDVTGSNKAALAVAVLYLAWTPTLASNLYDFHLEAFLPIELFAFFRFWRAGRFLAGGLVALLSFLTLEIAPVFAFFVGIFFLVSSLGRSFAVEPGEPYRGRWGRWTRGVRRWARSFVESRALAATGALCALSVVAYYALRWFQTVGVERWLGLPALPASFLPAGYGGLIGGTPAALGVSASNLLAFLPDKITYMIVVYALVLFLPWLAPRTQIVAIPWWLFTFFASRQSIVQLGFQYGFIAAFPVFLGVVYGARALRDLAVSLPAMPAGGGAPTSTTPYSPRVAPGIGIRAGFRPGFATLTVGLVLLVGVNVALTPVDPPLQGQWELGQGYQVRYSLPSSYADVERLVALVPANATVLASDQLFPLVANDNNAYVFVGWTPTYLYNFPFSPANLPPYLLVAQANLLALPAWIAGELYNPSAYGIRGVAWSTPLGPTVLFVRGYSGPVTEISDRGPVPLEFGATGLIPGVIGLPGGGPPPFVDVIGGEPGFVGPVWSGPGIALPPGSYRVEVAVRVVPAFASLVPPATASVASIQGDAFATRVWFHASYTYSALASPDWVVVSVPLRVSVPVFLVEIRGSQLSDTAVLEVGQIAFLPS